MLLSADVARCPRSLHRGDEAVHDGVEALVAEDELLGEGLEPQDRVDRGRAGARAAPRASHISPTW